MARGRGQRWGRGSNKHSVEALEVKIYDQDNDDQMAKSFENRWRWIFIWMTWFEVFGFWVLSAVGGLGFCLSGCEVLGFGDLVWWWVMSLPWWLVCCPKANFAWMYMSIFPKGDALPSLFPMWVFTLFPSLFGNLLVRRLLLRVNLDVRILSVWVMLRIKFSHHITLFHWRHAPR